VKLVCLTIFIFCGNHFLLAQNVANTIEYIWESNDGKTTARISIKPALEKASNKTIFYFIAMHDSINENFVDINYDSITKSLPTSYTGVKISLSQKLDSQEVRDLFLLSTLLVNDIFPFINKSWVLPKVNNTIIAGVDAGAEVALISALSFPNKFNKTALFFNKPFAGFAYSNQFDVLAPNIKGKLFMYVKHADGELNIIDEMANRLALKSSIMLYKIDAYNEEAISFEDGYKWLMADGNNYVIKTE
jgi:hypothetical protein